MGLAVEGWENITATALANLFSGSQFSLDTLTTLIQNGQLLEGMPEQSGGDVSKGYPPYPAADASALTQSIILTFFAYAIPQLWAAAGDGPFIVDSGASCGTVNPLSKYISDDTAQLTYACAGENNDHLYYLVAPIGKAVSDNCEEGRCTDNYFSAPPGLSALTGDSDDWGGLTKEQIIRG
jgi:hypothetical protein